MKQASLLILIVFFINNFYAIDNDQILKEKFPKKLSEFSFFKDTHAQIPVSYTHLTLPTNREV